MILDTDIGLEECWTGDISTIQARRAGRECPCGSEETFQTQLETCRERVSHPRRQPFHGSCEESARNVRCGLVVRLLSDVDAVRRASWRAMNE